MMDYRNHHLTRSITGIDELPTNYPIESPKLNKDDLSGERNRKPSKLILIDRYTELKQLKKYLTSLNFENYLNDEHGGID